MGKGGGLADDPWWRALMKGLAREAGVVDFDDGALRLMLHEWETALGAAAAAGPSDPPAKDPLPLPMFEEDEGPEWDCRPGEEFDGLGFDHDRGPLITTSDLRAALLGPKCSRAWPMAAGIYKPPSAPWPDVNPMVAYALEADRVNRCDFGEGFTVQYMQMLTQVRGARAHGVLVCDRSD
jgi:hypothetical protein